MSSSAFRFLLYFAIAVNLFKVYVDTTVCPIINLEHKSKNDVTPFVTLHDSYTRIWLHFGKNFQKLIFKIRIQSFISSYIFSKELKIDKKEIFPLKVNNTWHKMIVHATTKQVDWAPDPLILHVFVNQKAYEFNTGKWSLFREIETVYGYVQGDLQAAVDCQPIEPPPIVENNELHAHHSSQFPGHALTESVVERLHSTQTPGHTSTKAIVSTQNSTQTSGNVITKSVVRRLYLTQTSGHTSTKAIVRRLYLTQTSGRALTEPVVSTSYSTQFPGSSLIKFFVSTPYSTQNPRQALTDQVVRASYSTRGRALLKPDVSSTYSIQTPGYILKQQVVRTSYSSQAPGGKNKSIVSTAYSAKTPAHPGVSTYYSYLAQTPEHKLTESVVSTSYTTQTSATEPVVASYSVSKNGPVILIIILSTFAVIGLLVLLFISISMLFCWKKQQV